MKLPRPCIVVLGTATAVPCLTIAAIGGHYAGPAGYSIGAVVLGGLALVGLVDYQRHPLPGPEATIDDAVRPFPGCVLGVCRYLTSCEHCDTPVCVVHGNPDDVRTCVDSAQVTHCAGCEDEHLDGCRSCAAAVAGRW
ncbi:hypothetical protein D9V41_09105 [Aeromicrobium phragmitis]|uniref:Uncharacterized protein n=1 Tax=Aeromicrobium phragmitis TaxID=2478914 RepID=A0A3L8PKV9_9ACTN|nr:hypothetical protein [Aeromicrobium phragmitis]RLV56036.1 hypothetical protein D9V41_09105 [Aeromicrobium phragmitis]